MADAVRWLALVVALLVALPAAGQGLEPDDGGPLAPDPRGLRARAVPLADGIVRDGAWSVVRARIANGGEATRASLRLVELGLLDGEERVYEREVALPKGTVKDVSLYWRPGFAGGARRLQIATERGDDGALEIPVQQAVAPEDVAVAILGQEPLGLPVVASTWSAAVPSPAHRADAGRPRAVRHGLVPLPDLPERGVGYDAFDWVVWPNADPDRASVAQLEALAHWVAGGGHLLVTVSDGWRAVAGSPLGDLLPVALDGARDLPDLDPLVRVLVGGTPPPTARATHLVATGSLREVEGRWATALARTSDGQPLWAVGTYGLGTVHVLLADPAVAPLAGGVPREDLWRRLLWLPPDGADGDWLRDSLAGVPADRREAVVPPLAVALRLDQPASCVHGTGDPVWTGMGHSADSEIRSELADIPGVAPLPMSWLVGFALVYLLVIGPVDFLVLRRLGRQPLTWVTFPVAIVVFSAVALYGTSRAKGDQAVATRLDVVDLLPGTALGRGETWLGVFSTRRADVAVRSEHRDAATAPLDEPGFMEAVRMRSSEGAGELVYRARTWTLGYSRTRWSGPAEGGVRYEGGPDGGALVSSLPYALDDAVVHLGGDRLDLGRLEPGAPVPVALGDLAYNEPHEPFVRWQFREYRESGGHLHAPGGMMVTGVLDRPVAPLVLDGLSPRTKTSTLVRVPVDHPSSLVARGIVHPPRFTAFGVAR